MSPAVLLLAALAVQDPAEGDSYEWTEEAAVESALEETLAQPEFERLRARGGDEAEEAPEWLLSFFRWLLKLFAGDEAEEDRAGSALPPFARFFILTGVLLVVVFFLVKALASARRRRAIAEEDVRAALFQPGAAPGEIEPEEYWRRALEHGESLRYRDAVRELLFGAMSATERRGAIRYRRGLTNRDYLYAMRGRARLSFGSIAALFERVYFGRREATAETFGECCREYQKSFRGAPQ